MNTFNGAKYLESRITIANPRKGSSKYTSIGRAKKYVIRGDATIDASGRLRFFKNKAEKEKHLLKVREYAAKNNISVVESLYGAMDAMIIRVPRDREDKNLNHGKWTRIYAENELNGLPQLLKKLQIPLLLDGIC